MEGIVFLMFPPLPLSFRTVSAYSRLLRKELSDRLENWKYGDEIRKQVIPPVFHLLSASILAW